MIEFRDHDGAVPFAPPEPDEPMSPGGCAMWGLFAISIFVIAMALAYHVGLVG